MDAASGDPEKQQQPVPASTTAAHVEEGALAHRAVAFPDDEIHEEHRAPGMARPKGVEMKRELTQEDRELAAAGYQHLEEKKGKDFDKVDITEHNLKLTGSPSVAEALKANFDTKVPGHSQGLTTEEAKARLQRDGANICEIYLYTL